MAAILTIAVIIFIIFVFRLLSSNAMEDYYSSFEDKVEHEHEFLDSDKDYFRGKPVYYQEYGAGAYIRYSDSDEIVADFTCHLDAEYFFTYVNNLALSNARGRQWSLKNIITLIGK